MHQGEKIILLLKKNRISITKLSEDMDVKRTTLNDELKKSQVDPNILKFINKKYGIDINEPLEDSGSEGLKDEIIKKQEAEIDYLRAAFDAERENNKAQQKEIARLTSELLSKLTGKK